MATFKATTSPQRITLLNSLSWSSNSGNAPADGEVYPASLSATTTLSSERQRVQVQQLSQILGEALRILEDDDDLEFTMDEKEDFVVRQ